MSAWAGCAAALWLALQLVAQDDAAALVHRLGSADVNEQYEAYRELARSLPADAVALLGRRIAAFPSNAQSLGMSLLQQYPIDATRAVYRRLLQEGGPFLRATSAAALYRSGDRSAVDVLADAVTAAEGVERTLVLTRLYGVVDPRVADAIRALIRPGVDATGLESALYFLLTSTDLRRDATSRAAADLLVREWNDAGCRAACAAYLVAVGQTQHAPVLAAAIAADRSAAVRLMRFLDRAPRLGDELTAALKDHLASARNQGEVTMTARVLREHAAHDTAVALRGLLAASNPMVRKAALTALSEIPGALDAPALRGMLAADDAEVALLAADTLRRMDDVAGLDRVVELARATGPQRRRAYEVLGQFRVRAAVPPLLDALADADVSIREAAFAGLARLWSDLFPFRRIDLATTGYRPDAPPAERERGLAALRAFWSR